jgi:hypothetical protein
MNQRRGTLQVIAVACLILGAILLIFSVPFFWNQVQVLRTWPTAEAQILRSDVVVDRISQHEQLYSARLGLLYTLDDKPITTEVTSFQDQNYNKTRARADEFPVGSRHTIRYNPGTPTQVRVGAGWNLRFFALPIIVLSTAGIFFLATAVLLWVGRRSIAESPRTP